MPPIAWIQEIFYNLKVGWRLYTLSKQQIKQESRINSLAETINTIFPKLPIKGSMRIRREVSSITYTMSYMHQVLQNKDTDHWNSTHAVFPTYLEIS